MRYRVGDKVRIISKRPPKIMKLNWASPHMDTHCGKIVTIISHQGQYDGLDCYYTTANGGWTWKEDWLLPLTNFREGDKIKFKGTGQEIVLVGDFPYKDEEMELLSRKKLI